MRRRKHGAHDERTGGRNTLAAPAYRLPLRTEPERTRHSKRQRILLRARHRAPQTVYVSVAPVSHQHSKPTHTQLPPARPDAPACLSKSCTDKLALKQCTSLLNAVTSLLLAPTTAYLHTLVLPASQHVPAATARAFSPTGRLAALAPHAAQSWRAGYAYRPFAVLATTREFAWSRRAGWPGQKMVPSNLSAVCTPQWRETLISGVLQGRRQFDPRGASRVCRRGMWRAAADVAVTVTGPALVAVLARRRYGDVKGDGMLGERRRVGQDVKAAALKGWVSNDGDEEFGLDDVAGSMGVR